jgi:hypothetical protein
LRREIAGLILANARAHSAHANVGTVGIVRRLARRFFEVTATAPEALMRHSDEEFWAQLLHCTHTGREARRLLTDPFGVRVTEVTEGTTDADLEYVQVPDTYVLHPRADDEPAVRIALEEARNQPRHFVVGWPEEVDDN